MKHASVALAAAAGTGFGLLLFAVIRAGVVQCLPDDPSGCTGCHLMREHHDSWSRSSHRKVASCHDCHTAHVGASRLLGQGEAGLRHALAQVLDGPRARVRKGRATRQTVEASCRQCHERVARAMLSRGGDGASCVSCHGAVGHAGGAFSLGALL